ncbi:MAG: hypothetical protein WBW84_01960 [Acidobacteriaceae bacterium]
MSEAIHLHPLVFTLQNAIEGCGFLAGVTVSGKAVMEQDENEEWWMYGVCPGAIAGGGGTPNEAFLNFGNRYKEILFDIADECQSFLRFKSEVESFFKAEDAEEKDRWNQALAVVRGNDSSLPEPFQKMPRKKAEDFEVGIRIERLENRKPQQYKPANNIPNMMSQAA